MAGCTMLTPMWQIADHALPRFDGKMSLLMVVIMATVGFPTDGAVACSNCQDTTQDPWCDRCRPGFYEDPNLPIQDATVCKDCLCNNHSDTCAYSVRSGSISCQNCDDNTQGPFCDSCRDGYYLDPDVPKSDPAVCKECPCNSHSRACTYNTQDKAVVCLNCGHNTQGPWCDRCKEGFSNDPGLPMDDATVCKECPCHNHSTSCTYRDGTVICGDCEHNTQGPWCDRCRQGFYDDPNLPIQDAAVCKECPCNNHSDTCAHSARSGSISCLNCDHNTQGPFCDSCREGYYLDPDVPKSDPAVCKVLSLPPVINLMTGVTCSASSEYSSSYVCENAFDGVTSVGSRHKWISRDNGDGAWIQIFFPRMVTIDSVYLWQGCHIGYQYSRYTLTFSDGSEQQMTTPCNGGSSQTDCSGVPMEHRQLTRVETTSVRLTGYGDCGSTQYNGLEEIRFFGW